MSQLQRYLLLMVCLLAREQCRAQLPVPAPQQVQIENLSLPGAFEIRATDSPVFLSAHAIIEKSTQSGWVRVASNVLLGEVCARNPSPECISLAAGASLRPVRWTGFSCSAQCNRQCKKNVYRGPGTFRLTIFSCDKTVRFHGPPFKLPSAPR